MFYCLQVDIVLFFTGKKLFYCLQINNCFIFTGVNIEKGHSRDAVFSEGLQAASNVATGSEVAQVINCNIKLEAVVKINCVLHAFYNINSQQPSNSLQIDVSIQN